MSLTRKRHAWLHGPPVKRVGHETGQCWCRSGSKAPCPASTTYRRATALAPPQATAASTTSVILDPALALAKYLGHAVEAARPAAPSSLEPCSPPRGPPAFGERARQAGTVQAEADSAYPCSLIVDPMQYLQTQLPTQQRSLAQHSTAHSARSAPSAPSASRGPGGATERRSLPNIRNSSRRAPFAAGSEARPSAGSPHAARTSTPATASSTQAGQAGGDAPCAAGEHADEHSDRRAMERAYGLQDAACMTALVMDPAPYLADHLLEDTPVLNHLNAAWRSASRGHPRIEGLAPPRPTTPAAARPTPPPAAQLRRKPHTLPQAALRRASTPAQACASSAAAPARGLPLGLGSGQQTRLYAGIDVRTALGVLTASLQDSGREHTAAKQAQPAAAEGFPVAQPDSTSHDAPMLGSSECPSTDSPATGAVQLLAVEGRPAAGSAAASAEAGVLPDSPSAAAAAAPLTGAEEQATAAAVDAPQTRNAHVPVAQPSTMDWLRRMHAEQAPWTAGSAALAASPHAHTRASASRTRSGAAAAPAADSASSSSEQQACGAGPLRARQAALKAKRSMRSSASRSRSAAPPAVDEWTNATALDAIHVWKQVIRKYNKHTKVPSPTSQEREAETLYAFSPTTLPASAQTTLAKLTALDAAALDALHARAHAATAFIKVQYTRLAAHLAHKATRSQRSLTQDALAAAGQALQESIWLFDHSRGFAFHTFAKPYVHGKLSALAAQEGSVVQVPVYREQMRQRVFAAARELTGTTGSLTAATFAPEQVQGIADHLGVSSTRVNTVLALNRSILAPGRHMDSDALLVAVPDASGEAAGLDSLDAELGKDCLLDDLKAMIAALPERDAVMLAQRYGLQGGAPMSVAETAKAGGMTRANAYLRLKSAMSTLTSTGRCYLNSMYSV